jgi:hypothetical protein
LSRYYGHNRLEPRFAATGAEEEIAHVFTRAVGIALKNAAPTISAQELCRPAGKLLLERCCGD